MLDADGHRPIRSDFAHIVVVVVVFIIFIIWSLKVDVGMVGQGTVGYGRWIWVWERESETERECVRVRENNATFAVDSRL